MKSEVSPIESIVDKELIEIKLEMLIHFTKNQYVVDTI